METKKKKKMLQLRQRSWYQLMQFVSCVCTTEDRGIHCRVFYMDCEETQFLCGSWHRLHFC